MFNSRAILFGVLALALSAVHADQDLRPMDEVLKILSQNRPRPWNGPVPWTNCGDSSDHLKNLHVYVSPDPPRKGTEVNVTVSGNLDETVTGGKIELKVSMGFPIIDKKYNLCDSFGLKCPFPKGPVTMQFSETIPGFAPSGTYDLEAIVSDQNKQQVACVKADLHIQ